MKTLTKKKQLISKKQKEFYEFIDQKILPYFEECNKKFDTINPTLMQDEWYGDDILITIPYGERMEPWLLRAINECYAYENKTITVVMGAKINTNAWHKYVFPFAIGVAFVKGGKRPTAIVTYTKGCQYKAFYNDINGNINYAIGILPTDIDNWIAKGFSEAYFNREEDKEDE